LAAAGAAEVAVLPEDWAAAMIVPVINKNANSLAIRVNVLPSPGWDF
jgi:hypothetical protein